MQNLSSKIAKLEHFLGEVEYLRTLRFDNQEEDLWTHKVRDTLSLWFGKDSEEYKRFRGPTSFVPYHDQVQKQRQYDEHLTIYETELKSVIQLLEMRQEYRTGPDEDGDVETIPALKIFIAHGGPSGARDKLEQFLRALGAEPVIVESAAGAAESPGGKVNLQLNDCHFGIVLATKARGAMQDGKLLPRANLIDEMARFQHVLGDRRMLLLEKGLSLPSNASDWTYQTFSPQSMDRAFTAILVELKDHRFLSVRGPGKGAQ